MRHNLNSQIILIITVITFALAVPVLVKEKRQSRVDEVHAPEDVMAVLGKRAGEQYLDILWDVTHGLRHPEDAWGNRNPPGVHPPGPPPLPLDPAVLHPELHAPPQNPGVQVPEVHAPPQNLAGVQVPEAHAPPQNPGDSDRELIELDGDAPPGSPEDSPPTSPKGSTESDSGMDRWSTISNVPSAESQSENLKAADTEMRGKAKALPGISGTSGVNN